MLSPGEEGKIEVKFDISGRRGLEVKRVDVQTNDPNRTKVTLVVKALIEPEFWLEERSLYLGNLNSWDSFDRRIKIGAKDLKSLSVESVRPSHSDIKAELIFQDEQGEKTPYLHLSGGPGLPAGRFQRWAEVVFDSTRNLRDRVFLMAQVMGDLRISPERLRLGYVGGRYLAEEKFLVYSESGNSFKILQIKENVGSLSFEVVPLVEGTRYQITVRENEDYGKKWGSTMIMIYTDREAENLLQVPISVLQKK